VQGQLLTVGQTIQGQASLDGPIVCPNGSNPCDVEMTIISSNPSDLEYQPQFDSYSRSGPIGKVNNHSNFDIKFGERASLLQRLV